MVAVVVGMGPLAAADRNQHRRAAADGRDPAASSHPMHPQGGLPTFLDVGSSFSASAVAEDNLLSQLRAAGGRRPPQADLDPRGSGAATTRATAVHACMHACMSQHSTSLRDRSPARPAGKRMAFVGDDTWQQLAAGAFEWAWPFPSFNVKDLHSVDDGVWRVSGGSWWWWVGGWIDGWELLPLQHPQLDSAAEAPATDPAMHGPSHTHRPTRPTHTEGAPALARRR
jgi:hypothetical protein